MYKYLANTVFTGKNLVYLPTCHSTNDTAREYIKSGRATDGIIIITDEQTSGRGQRGNKWLAAPGENITMSVIFKPGFLLAGESFWLNIITSLAIHDFLAEYGISSSIKWPNDIYAGKKKISGILIENLLDGKNINYSIIGIGLNVNQLNFEVGTATSMHHITNRVYNLGHILESIATNLEKHYIRLKNGGSAAMKANYLNSLLGFHKDAEYEVDGITVKGRISGVDSDGRLKVEIAGEMRYFSFKEIKFLI